MSEDELAAMFGASVNRAANAATGLQQQLAAQQQAQMSSQYMANLQAAAMQQTQTLRQDSMSGEIVTAWRLEPDGFYYRQVGSVTQRLNPSELEERNKLFYPVSSYDPKMHSVISRSPYYDAYQVKEDPPKPKRPWTHNDTMVLTWVVVVAIMALAGMLL